MEAFDKQVVSDRKKEEILASAERTLHYTNLLIEQCDSWLPAEEGNKEMERRILERQRKEQLMKIKKFFGISRSHKL